MIFSAKSLDRNYWSIVYNRIKVYRHENFLKLVVHVRFIDHETKPFVRNPGNGYLKPRYSCHFAYQSTVQRGLSVKPGQEDIDSMRRSITVCTVCLNYRKLRVK